MTLICEECGKIYHIDPEKLKDKLTGDVAKTKCRVCGHVITISKQEIEAGETAAVVGVQVHSMGRTEAPVAEPLEDSLDEGAESSSGLAQPGAADERFDASSARIGSSGTKKGLGLRAKMFLLFLVVPLTLMAGAGYFTQLKLKALSNQITAESRDLMMQLAEETIADKSRAVALQCKIYLLSHPELSKDNFNYDPEFKRISVQRVGVTGYTVLFERPGLDEGNEGFYIWTHPNPRLVGLPANETMKQQLGEKYNEFALIFDRVKQGKESTAYYDWPERDGTSRRKFMACSPVDGTRYFVMSTAYIDEFTGRVKKMETTARELTAQTRNVNLVILVGALIIIGLSILIYGYRITRNIKYLTAAADSISVGELDTKIDLKSNDEIGNLADAISRMQDSLRLSIERLRRRR